MPTSEPGQDRHRCSVRAGQLNGQRSLDLVLRGGGLNHGKRGIHGGFRDAAEWQSSGGLAVEARITNEGEGWRTRAWRRGGGFEPPHGGINFTNKAEIDTLKAAISENCTEIERARSLPLDDTSSIRAHLGNTRLRKCRIASRAAPGPPVRNPIFEARCAGGAAPDSSRNLCFS
jgi:hypothetical protein